MFTSSLRESAQNEIELMDVDGDALWALVLYCYTGKKMFELRKFKNINVMLNKEYVHIYIYIFFKIVFLLIF